MSSFCEKISLSFSFQILFLFSFHLCGNKSLYIFLSVFGGNFAALLITSAIYSNVFMPCILHEHANEYSITPLSAPLWLPKKSEFLLDSDIYRLYLSTRLLSR